MIREIPRRGWALITETLTTTFSAVAAGVGSTFLAMVFGGFLAEEGFADI